MFDSPEDDLKEQLRRKMMGGVGQAPVSVTDQVFQSLNRAKDDLAQRIQGLTQPSYSPVPDAPQGFTPQNVGDATVGRNPTFVQRLGSLLNNPRFENAVEGFAGVAEPTAGGVEGFLGTAAQAFTGTRQAQQRQRLLGEEAATKAQDRDLQRRNIESQIADRGRAATSGVTPEYITDPSDPTMEIQVDRDRQGNRVPALFNGQPIRRSKTSARGAGTTANQSFDNVGALRREFNQQVVPHQVIARSARAIEEAAAHPSAAGDLSLIFAFMKVLDPGSTVREGEFANAQNAGSVPNRVVALYNRVMSGERLSEAQRADFLAQSRGLVQSQRQQARQYIDRYSQLARQYGFDPSEVVSDPYEFPAAATAVPAPSGTDPYRGLK